MLQELLNQVLVEVTVSKNKETVLFVSDLGERWEMYHDQECCETVSVEDVVGDLDDLIGSPILQAEESTSNEGGKDDDSSFTWTFYKFATAKGYVTIRWYGESNGYYSESVNFRKLKGQL